MAVIRGVAQSGRVLALGARCRRFESFRPDQKIQTVANAAVLIFWVARADSNDKPPFVGGSNLSLGRVATCVYPRIYANCAGLVLIYSDSLGLCLWVSS